MKIPYLQKLAFGLLLVASLISCKKETKCYDCFDDNGNLVMVACGKTEKEAKADFQNNFNGGMYRNTPITMEQFRQACKEK